MVLKLKPMGKPTTYKYQVLDRTKVLHGPRTQTYGKVSYLRRILSCSILGSNTRKGLGYESYSEDGETPYYSATCKSCSFLGYMFSDDYLLHRIEHSAVISAILGYVSFSQVDIIVPNNSIKFIIISFS